VSNLAHVYSSPDFTESRSLLTAPLGSRAALLETLERDGRRWVRVFLPDGRTGFLAAEDVRVGDAADGRPLGAPADWIALGLRFVGAPYTWGGTTPLGFDCSGLVYRILAQHGVVLARNSYEMAFRETRLVPVAFDRLQPGDLLFFGTVDRIDHVAMWMGGGRVLQATTDGRPSTQVTEYGASIRLTARYRYARRLAALPGAPRPGPLAPERLAALERTLRALVAEGGAGYGVYFKDLSGGGTVAIDAGRAMHAASSMKTNVMLEVLRRVDAGVLQWTAEIPVANDFRSLVDGSPFSIGLESNDGPTAEGAVRSLRLSPAARARAWEILTAQTFNDQIPAGLHPQSGAVVGHKTGAISSVQHDAAVVRLPDGREYVLVVLADGFGANEAGRERVIRTSRRISRAAWEAMIAP